ncbi:choloylglycine hydrolase family protein [uncultured Traorella sp.]|uniref:choloylglycine hydrolase family protein n=1 Tax=uncultured Traorella sp. TaxID=1929048 RepID=UPI0025F85E25|nr:choloylglycine hydrolase family protein [uncultured Traorella sp.]
MCTAINFLNQQHENVFGRTMDFHYNLSPCLAVFPAGSAWECALGKLFTDRYAVAGIGRHFKNRYVLFDGVNEKGLAGGALYFKGYADFPQFSQQSDKIQVPALDFLHYVLGFCASLDDLRELLADITLVGIQDGLTGTVAPLHWIFTDSSGRSVVVEQTKLGLNIYENPVGVLTNSPDFLWQMTNLRNYIEVTPEQTNKANWGGFLVEPFGQAAGTSTLPGGYTPPARFVRTTFQKLHMVQPEGMQEAIIAGFHILEGVTLPNGVVKTANGTFDYTQYTSMIDLQNKVYYFKTYENPQIIRVDLKPFWKSGKTVQDLGSIHLPIHYGTMD